MRKFTLPVFIAVGALLGLLSAAQDGWGTRMVMMGIGVLFAAPMGAVFAGLKRGDRKVTDWPETPATRRVTSPQELARNYWRDEGHPPFMKPSDDATVHHKVDAGRLL